MESERVGGKGGRNEMVIKGKETRKKRKVEQSRGSGGERKRK